MKIWQSEHIFNHPWDTVVQAAWRKYPNPMNPNVVGLDVVERGMGPDGVLRSHRLMATQWGLPDWVTRLVGMNRVCYVSEHSEVNPEKQEMSLRSRNLTFSNLVSIDEHLVYKPNPADPSSTLLQQEAVISVQGVPLTDYMEKIMIGTCSGNAQKGRQAMEWVISKIKTEAHDLQRAAQESMDKFMHEAQESMDKFKTETQESMDKFKHEAQDMRRAAKESMERAAKESIENLAKSGAL